MPCSPLLLDLIDGQKWYLRAVNKIPQANLLLVPSKIIT